MEHENNLIDNSVSTFMLLSVVELEEETVNGLHTKLKHIAQEKNALKTNVLKL